MDEHVVLTNSHYDRAFACMATGECPQTNDQTGCPFWIQIDSTRNEADGLERSRRVEGCGMAVLCHQMTEVTLMSIMAANTSSETAEQGKKQAVEVGRLARVAAIALDQATHRQPEQVQLVDGGADEEEN